MNKFPKLNYFCPFLKRFCTLNVQISVDLLTSRPKLSERRISNKTKKLREILVALDTKFKTTYEAFKSFNTIFKSNCADVFKFFLEKSCH